MFTIILKVVVCFLGTIIVIPEETLVEVVEHSLPENERMCSVCGSKLIEIGVEIHRSLQMKPAEFWVREDRYPTYTCKNCGKETGEAIVVPTPMDVFCQIKFPGHCQIKSLVLPRYFTRIRAFLKR